MKDYILTVHDEMISNLILMNCNNIIYYDDYPSRIAVINGKRVVVSLKATSKRYDAYLEKMKDSHTKLNMKLSNDNILKNNYSLSAQEIIIYLILLHHYIISSTDKAAITIKELNKEYRQIRSMNDCLFDTYIKTLYRLSNKKLSFKIKKKYVGNHKLTNYYDTHNLLNIIDLIPLDKDYRVIYDLGTFGKIIKESKNYSTIVPKGVYSCKRSQINYLLLFLYISRIVYMNRNQKHQAKTLSLRTICKNICKYDKKGFNMNITYEDVFDGIQKLICNKEYNIQFYELDADDARAYCERKERYLLEMAERSRKKIDKCINKNRDLQLIKSNLRSVLTILKDTHQIYDYVLINTSKVGNDPEEKYCCTWSDINGKNWDEFVIDILFSQNNTSSIKDNTSCISNGIESTEIKGNHIPKMVRDENERC